MKSTRIKAILRGFKNDRFLDRFKTVT